MAVQRRAKSGGTKKYGRDAEKCKLYRALKIREKNKLKRVLKSNGLLAAQAYAREHVLTAYLKTL